MHHRRWHGATARQGLHLEFICMQKQTQRTMRQADGVDDEQYPERICPCGAETNNTSSILASTMRSCSVLGRVLAVHGCPVIAAPAATSSCRGSGRVDGACPSPTLTTKRSARLSLPHKARRTRRVARPGTWTPMPEVDGGRRFWPWQPPGHVPPRCPAPLHVRWPAGGRPWPGQPEFQPAAEGLGAAARSRPAMARMTARRGRLPTGRCQGTRT